MASWVSCHFFFLFLCRFILTYVVKDLTLLLLQYLCIVYYLHVAGPYVPFCALYLLLFQHIWIWDKGNVWVWAYFWLLIIDFCDFVVLILNFDLETFHGFVLQKIIPFQEVTSVKRAKTAGIFPTAIEIFAGGRKVVLDLHCCLFCTLCCVAFHKKKSEKFLFHVWISVTSAISKSGCSFGSTSLHHFCPVTKLWSSSMMDGCSLVMVQKQPQNSRCFNLLHFLIFISQSHTLTHTDTHVCIFW